MGYKLIIKKEVILKSIMFAKLRLKKFLQYAAIALFAFAVAFPVMAEETSNWRMEYNKKSKERLERAQKEQEKHRGDGEEEYKKSKAERKKMMEELLEQVRKDPCTPQPISFDKYFEKLKKPGWHCKDADSYQPGIANWIVNGVKINIPREYIIAASNEPDGPSISGHLKFYYPDMTGKRKLVEPGNERKASEISARYSWSEGSLDSVRCFDEWWNKWCKTKKQQAYTSALGPAGSPKNQFEDVMNNAKPVYDEKLDMYYYDPQPNNFLPGTKSLGRMYYHGNIEDPDYWLICEGICKSKLWFEDGKIEIEYSFSQTLRFEHEEIRKKLNEKIDSFIEK